MAVHYSTSTRRPRKRMPSELVQPLSTSKQPLGTHRVVVLLDTKGITNRPALLQRTVVLKQMHSAGQAIEDTHSAKKTCTSNKTCNMPISFPISLPHTSTNAWPSVNTLHMSPSLSANDSELRYYYY
jgi:hypothetical protein